MRLVLVLTAMLLLTLPAKAADYNLICQNPGREYNITFSDGDKAAVINPDSSDTHQPVLAVINNDAERMIVLDLGTPGMASVLHLRPYLKNDIYAEGELVQTDACREVLG